MLWLKPITVSQMNCNNNQLYLVSAGGHVFVSTAKRYYGIVMVDDVAHKVCFSGMDIECVSEIHKE